MHLHADYSTQHPVTGPLIMPLITIDTTDYIKGFKCTLLTVSSLLLVLSNSVFF